MGRKEEILQLLKDVEHKDLLVKSVDDLLFLEDQLEELRTKPHIKYHPTNPSLQKRTEAGKLYKEYLQQYNNLVKTLCSVLYKNDSEASESPLRIYFEKVNGKR